MLYKKSDFWQLTASEENLNLHNNRTLNFEADHIKVALEVYK